MNGIEPKAAFLLVAPNLSCPLDGCSLESGLGVTKRKLRKRVLYQGKFTCQSIVRLQFIS